MLNFRIQGFDILPDIVGYIFFAFGFAALASNSEHFKSFQAEYSDDHIIHFSIYESPAQDSGINVNFDSANALGILIGIISLILDLLIVYHLFMGIRI